MHERCGSYLFMRKLELKPIVGFGCSLTHLVYHEVHRFVPGKRSNNLLNRSGFCGVAVRLISQIWWTTRDGSSGSCVPKLPHSLDGALLPKKQVAVLTTIF